MNELLISIIKLRNKQLVQSRLSFVLPQRYVPSLIKLLMLQIYRSILRTKPQVSSNITMAGNVSPKPHAIMVSFPYQGHITPYINLAAKLASNGFIVTFAHLEFIHHKLSQSFGSIGKVDFFSEARESGLDIRYTTIGDGFPLNYDRSLNLEEYWETMMVEFSDRVDEFVAKIIECDPYSTPFLVTDVLFTWPAAIAKKYNLLNVSFWTEPALVFSLNYHMDLLQENGHFPCKEHAEEEITYVPGIETISTKDLMPYLKERQIGSIPYKIAVRSFKESSKADFILHNTVLELESEILFALNKYQPNYTIGPINVSKTIATSTISKSLWSESDCSGWLESKPPGSVLYVSFGSLVQTTKEVIEEIAHGPLLSEVNFIWVVRVDAVSSVDSDDPLDGFKDRIRDRGLVVPWCDQIKVLSNRAVGGFLTHCGWNSILESIWYGVPMLCYPLEYDQPPNRKLVVDDWKIGINVCDGNAVDGKEVARKIKNLMCSEELKKEVKRVT